MACCNKICKILKALLPFLGIFLVIGAFHFTNFFVLKYYPPIMNFILFLIFFTSLFKEKTVIQEFALAMEPDADWRIMNYTRNVTYVWAGFTFLNFMISLATVFMSEKLWAIYNGFLSYIFVGLVFIIEYLIRIRFLAKIK